MAIKSKTHVVAKQEAIDILRKLYRELMEKVEAGNAFDYGTINGVALARIQIELDM